MEELKIALIGSAPSSVRLAPYHDPSWKIWGCSPGVYGIAPRVDMWWELHRFEPGQPWFSPEYCQWMSKLNVPVMMAEVRPEIPTSCALPHEALVAKYGPYFFTSSLAWMMATAIEAGATKIGLWGVDMAACPSPDTKVLTADLRWVRADTLELGQKIMAFDEEPQANGDSTKKRKWRVAEVVRNDRIRKPCYRLTLEDGRELICSDEHKWLTYAENTSRWVMAKDLVTPHHRPDRPTRIIKLCDVWEEDRSWEAGYLAAAVDGEGHLTQKITTEDYAMLRVGFAQRDNPMSLQVQEAANKLGFEFGTDSREDGSNGDTVKYSLRGGRSKTMEFLGRIRPRRLLQKFHGENLGILQKQGTVAVVKAEFIGEQDVIGLTTSTGTFIAEGLATHNTDEYGYQRAGCQFFAQIAKAMGIEVGVPPESDLFRPNGLYGVDEVLHCNIKSLARKREIEQRLANAQQVAQNALNETHFLRGALDDMTYQMATWLDKREFTSPPDAPGLTNLVKMIPMQAAPETFPPMP